MSGLVHFQVSRRCAHQAQHLWTVAPRPIEWLPGCGQINLREEIVRLDHAMQIVSLLATAVLSPVSVDRYTHDPPRVDRVEPDVAKPNEIVTAFGSNLDRTYVVDLILSSPDSDA